VIFDVNGNSVALADLVLEDNETVEWRILVLGNFKYIGYEE
jgi:hypothetical protein